MPRCRTICVIPIKKNSYRVENKNKKLLLGKPLFAWTLEKIPQMNFFDRIVVDSDCEEIKEYCLKNKIEFLERVPELSKDTANGNHLIYHWSKIYPEYDYYFQLFVTSPFIKISTIKKCFNALVQSKEFDSVTTVFEETGFFWMDNRPLNYDPAVLPRTQDCKKIVNETTALYGVTSDSLKSLKNRLGNKPVFINVEHRESIDIDTYSDFVMAEFYASIESNKIGDYMSVVKNDEKKNLAIDFDGVVHNDCNGFYDGTIYGEAIAGSIEAIKKLSQKYNIIIHTCKARKDRPLVNNKAGEQLVREWLDTNGLKGHYKQITSQKPRSFLYIDDKGFRFSNWPQCLEFIELLNGGKK
jgi:CMP-N-acetylneuraminic acid synthetase